MINLSTMLIDSSSRSLSETVLFPVLSSSDVFKYANGSTNINGERLSVVLPKMIMDSDEFHHISYSQLSKESQFKLLESRNIKIKNKEEIRKSLEIGDIILVYSEVAYLPVGIPFVLRKMIATRYIAYVPISEYAKLNKNAEIEILNNSSVLASIMTAYLAIANMSGKLKHIPKDTLFPVAATYGKMFSSVIALNSNTNDIEMKYKLEYLGVRFFYYSIAEDIDEGDKLFYDQTENWHLGLNLPIINALDTQFPMESFESFEKLLITINEVYPGLRNADLRSFVERWIRSYGPGATFAIDYPGYMFFVILSVILGGSQVNTRTISSCLYKGYEKLFDIVQKY